MIEREIFFIDKFETQSTPKNSRVNKIKETIIMEVRQPNTIYPKLFTLTPKNVFK